MRRSVEEHKAQPWRVHAFASDFELLDVWRFPVRLRSEISLETFLGFLTEMHSDLVRGGGMAAQLFRLRGWMGRVFGWDRESGPASERLADAEATQGSVGGFDPVFATDDEALFELENATVHALMHLGRVAVEDRDSSGLWAPQMAVYVKPRGYLGRVYMKLIQPFRHLIVYPAMMRSAQRSWPPYESRLALAPLRQRE
jgi:hypothetical protein